MVAPTSSNSLSSKIRTGLLSTFTLKPSSRSLRTVAGVTVKAVVRHVFVVKARKIVETYRHFDVPLRVFQLSIFQGTC